MKKQLHEFDLNIGVYFHRLNYITELPENYVFVFGSNLAGKHGAGAANTARNFFRAEYGIGEGRTGRSYALPTKGRRLEILSLDQIQVHVNNFIDYAHSLLTEEPSTILLLTEVGCGLAGYKPEHIAGLFANSIKNYKLSNIIYPYNFLTYL